MDWFMILKSFVVGGLICVVGQILIDKTKLTPARILVTFVTIGAVLGGLGIYKKLIDFAGCGATVPLTGFGNLLSKGAIEGVKESGILGAIMGGAKSASARNFCSNIFWIYSIFSFKTKDKKTIRKRFYGYLLKTSSKKFWISVKKHKNPLNLITKELQINHSCMKYIDYLCS